MAATAATPPAFDLACAAGALADASLQTPKPERARVHFEPSGASTPARLGFSTPARARRPARAMPPSPDDPEAMLRFFRARSANLDSPIFDAAVRDSHYARGVPEIRMSAFAPESGEVPPHFAPEIAGDGVFDGGGLKMSTMVDLHWRAARVPLPYAFRVAFDPKAVVVPVRAYLKFDAASVSHMFVRVNKNVLEVSSGETSDDTADESAPARPVPFEGAADEGEFTISFWAAPCLELRRGSAVLLLTVIDSEMKSHEVEVTICSKGTKPVIAIEAPGYEADASRTQTKVVFDDHVNKDERMIQIYNETPNGAPVLAGVYLEENAHGVFSLCSLEQDEHEPRSEILPFPIPSNTSFAFSVAFNLPKAETVSLMYYGFIVVRLAYFLPLHPDYDDEMPHYYDHVIFLEAPRADGVPLAASPNTPRSLAGAFASPRTPHGAQSDPASSGGREESHPSPPVPVGSIDFPLANALPPPVQFQFSDAIEISESSLLEHQALFDATPTADMTSLEASRAAMRDAMRAYPGETEEETYQRRLKARPSMEQLFAELDANAELEANTSANAVETVQMAVPEAEPAIIDPMRAIPGETEEETYQRRLKARPSMAALFAELDANAADERSRAEAKLQEEEENDYCQNFNVQLDSSPGFPLPGFSDHDPTEQRDPLENPTYPGEESARKLIPSNLFNAPETYERNLSGSPGEKERYNGAVGVTSAPPYHLSHHPANAGEPVSPVPRAEHYDACDEDASKMRESPTEITAVARPAPVKLRITRDVRENGVRILSSDSQTTLPLQNASHVPVTVRLALVGAGCHKLGVLSARVLELPPRRKARVEIARFGRAGGSASVHLSCTPAGRAAGEEVAYNVRLTVEPARARARLRRNVCLDRPTISFHAPADGENVACLRVLNATTRTASVRASVRDVLVSPGPRGVASATHNPFVMDGSESVELAASACHLVRVQFAPVRTEGLEMHYSGWLDIVSHSDGKTLRESIPLFGYSGISRIVCAVENGALKAFNEGSRAGYLRLSGERAQGCVVVPGDVQYVPVPADWDGAVITGDEIERSRLREAVRRRVVSKNEVRVMGIFDEHFAGEEMAREAEDLVWRDVCDSSLHYASRLFRAGATQSVAESDEGVLQGYGLPLEEQWRVTWTDQNMVHLVNGSPGSKLKYEVHGAEPGAGTVPELGDALLKPTADSIVIIARGRSVQLDR